MKRALFIIVAAWLFTVSMARAQTPRAADPSSAAVMARFDRRIVKEFREAWRRAGNGTTAVEAVILLVRDAAGNCKVISIPATNENRQMTFQWQPGTIAIIHTHPNRNDPGPSPADVQIADRFHVPMFTLTIKGMYLYDPATKAVSRVQPGIDWMEEAKWARYAPMLARQLATHQ